MKDIKCVLHVGAHKTGTSLLQKYLRDRPNDRDALGIAYVDRSDTGSLIGWGAVPQTSPKKLRRAVTRAADLEHRIVVISHEDSLGKPFIPGVSGLYPDSRACANGLANAVAEFDAIVIYYIRSQAEFIESYYLQTVHQGGYRSFSSWVADVDLTSCSWTSPVDILRASFGSDRVAVRDFAEISQGQNAFIEGFLNTFTNTTTIDIDYSSRRNPSISATGLDIALDVNPLLETTQERQAMRKFLQEHFNNKSGDRPTLFGTEDRRKINHMFASENANLVDRTQ